MAEVTNFILKNGLLVPGTEPKKFFDTKITGFELRKQKDFEWDGVAYSQFTKSYEPLANEFKIVDKYDLKVPK